MNGTTTKPVPVTKPARFSVEMSVDKLCQGSVRYVSGSKTDPLNNVYVGKTFVNDRDMPRRVRVTIEEID